DGVFEGDLAPEPLDRELAEEQQDRRTHDGDLAYEPRRAVRDLWWAWLAIAGAAGRFSGKALRDRGAVGQMILIDASTREPSSEFGAGTTREGQTGGELDRAGRLTDDHDAIGRMSG